VKQLPAGQFKLRADATLCLARGGGDLPPLLLSPCDAAAATQLWVREMTSTDGPYITGPITSMVDGKVIDIEAGSTSLDAKIDVYSYFCTPNQLVEYNATSGLVRFAQSGMCLGACAFL